MWFGGKTEAFLYKFVYILTGRSDARAFLYLGRKGVGEYKVTMGGGEAALGTPSNT